MLFSSEIRYLEKFTSIKYLLTQKCQGITICLHRWGCLLPLLFLLNWGFQAWSLHTPNDLWCLPANGITNRAVPILTYDVTYEQPLCDRFHNSQPDGVHAFMIPVSLAGIMVYFRMFSFWWKFMFRNYLSYLPNIKCYFLKHHVGNLPIF